MAPLKTFMGGESRKATFPELHPVVGWDKVLDRL
jgi:hypothetical protein